MAPGPLGPTDQAGPERREVSGLCGASGVDCAALCVCELEQLAGGELLQCQNEADTGNLVGFCYIDPALMVGAPELVADCPASTQRSLRFVDPRGGIPQPGATMLLACTGASL